MRLHLLLLVPLVVSQPGLFEPLSDLDKVVQVCDSTNSENSFIYCSGPLLDAVNVQGIFNDSKTFVDMPMKYDPEVVHQAFLDKFGSQKSEDMDRDELIKFLDEHFTPPGSELVACTPTDWQENPPQLNTIVDPELRKWAMSLNGIWKTLCKKIDPSIEQHSARYSLIYVPNLFIAPGGRFREFYYWDAYWIVKGLIASEMYNTTRAMIENLGSMVDRYGFVPNGGRVYYLQRSQPPLLSGMVYEYFEATNDRNFVNKMLPTLEKELEFWNKNRMVDVAVNGTTYSVYQYRTPSNVPRPESYTEDVQKAAQLDNKRLFWQDVATAAESGWDFSTRWFADKKTIYRIETTNIVPIDLNSYICWNMDILEYLNEKVGNFDHSEKYREDRAHFRQAVTRVFYNNTDGTWYDYNLRTKSHNTHFYPSIATPLFSGCYNSLDHGKSERLFGYMKQLGVFEYQSGIPTSMVQDSEEQWDFPNGWSPLNHMIIEGLRKSHDPQMQDQAFQLAKKWVMGNYRVWKETRHMWEKYNVIGTYPRPGSGGEYNVQAGFGWTNGAILDLLVTYADRLRVVDDYATTSVKSNNGAQTTIQDQSTNSSRTTRSLTDHTTARSQTTTGDNNASRTVSLAILLVLALL